MKQPSVVAIAVLVAACGARGGEAPAAREPRGAAAGDGDRGRARAAAQVQHTASLERTDSGDELLELLVVLTGSAAGRLSSASMNPAAALRQRRRCAEGDVLRN